MKKNKPKYNSNQLWFGYGTIVGASFLFITSIIIEVLPYKSIGILIALPVMFLILDYMYKQLQKKVPKKR